jgi:hypothetical protein
LENIWQVHIQEKSTYFAIISPSHLSQMQPTWCAQMNQKIVVTYIFKYKNVSLKSVSKSIKKKAIWQT